jgi:membrane protein
MFNTWNLSGLSWTEFSRRVWSELKEDDILGRAAELSYYFLLALFPLLLFLVTLLGYFAESSLQLRDNLLSYLGSVMPYSAVELIHTVIDEISNEKGGGKLSFGLLAALWAASKGMRAITLTLNIAYDIRERRPWWKARLISIGLTLIFAILIISALVLVLYGGKLGELIATATGLGTTFTAIWKILQWPIVMAFLLIGFGCVYYFGPDLRVRHWEWVSPGAVVAIVLWLLVSLVFRVFLLFYNSYSATYGSLGALIILMLWFYLTGIAILVGGEINSELEHAAEKRKKQAIA